MSLPYVHMTVTAAEAKAQQVSISEKEFTHFIQAFHSFDIWQADRQTDGRLDRAWNGDVIMRQLTFHIHHN